MTREEIDAAIEEAEQRIRAVYANHQARMDDNPDSMRYHQRDQGGSTVEDYRAANEAQPWVERREYLRRLLEHA